MHSQPSASTDSQTQIENSTGIYWEKRSCVSRPAQFKHAV